VTPPADERPLRDIFWLKKKHWLVVLAHAYNPSTWEAEI
jgi:hypothetical protein